MSHHCVITGTGRTGTTFLVILLTRLGVDTGYTAETATYQKASRGGLEHVYVTPSSPYLIKSPWLCNRIDIAIKRHPDLVIDRVLLPVRAIEAAAESRAYAQEQGTGSRDGTGIAGGLWLTKSAATQEAMLRKMLSTLIVSLARHDIPLTLLWYPRLVRDPAYLYEKLKFLLGDTSFEKFERVFSELVRPDWVHKFTEADA